MISKITEKAAAASDLFQSFGIHIEHISGGVALDWIDATSPAHALELARIKWSAEPGVVDVQLIPGLGITYSKTHEPDR